MPTFDEKIISLEANAEIFNTVVNGDNTTSVTTESGQTIKSLAKFFLDIETALGNSLNQLYSPLGNISGTVNLDLENFQIYSGTLTGSTTFTFSGLPVVDKFLSVSLYLKQDIVGGKVMTFPGTVLWDSGVAPNPILDPSVDYLFNFISFNRGVSWLGFLVGYDFS